MLNSYLGAHCYLTYGKLGDSQLFKPRGYKKVLTFTTEDKLHRPTDSKCYHMYVRLSDKSTPGQEKVDRRA